MRKASSSVGWRSRTSYGRFFGMAPHFFGFLSLPLFHRELRCALFFDSLLLRLIFCL